MIIDFHAHVFPDKIAAATIGALSSGANIPAHASGTLDGLCRSMDEAGVDISVNLPVLTKPTQFDSIFAFAKEMNEKCKRVISFAGIHPSDENYHDHLYMVKEAGFLGVKIHPDYQGTFFDDQRYVNILSLAKKLDLITLTHAGFDGAFVGQEIKCTPTRTLRLLDKIGGYGKLVLAHLGGNELYGDVLEELCGENVYFDTAYVLPFLTQAQVEKVILKHGEGKILFATDSPWQGQREMVDIVKSFGLPKETENKIFCENAKNLLKL